VAYQERFVVFFTGPILGPIFITLIMTIISKPMNLGVLGSLLHFGEVPDFLRQLLTQKNLVHAFAGALVSAVHRLNLCTVIFICGIEFGVYINNSCGELILF
jgi:hypothetical protein